MANIYKVKENCDASTSDLWYDLFDGNLHPKDILENDMDINEVEAAIKVLKKFRRSCEQIEGFYF